MLDHAPSRYLGTYLGILRVLDCQNQQNLAVDLGTDVSNISVPLYSVLRT
jgi:hypothetical protein